MSDDKKPVMSPERREIWERWHAQNLLLMMAETTRISHQQVLCRPGLGDGVYEQREALALAASEAAAAAHRERDLASWELHELDARLDLERRHLKASTEYFERSNEDSERWRKLRERAKSTEDLADKLEGQIGALAAAVEKKEGG